MVATLNEIDLEVVVDVTVTVKSLVFLFKLQVKAERNRG